MNYPCFCLKRGFFLLITYKRPFLRTILHSALRFFIEALTFILFDFNRFLFSVRISPGPIYYLYLKMILPLVRS